MRFCLENMLILLFFLQRFCVSIFNIEGSCESLSNSARKTLLILLSCFCEKVFQFFFHTSEIEKSSAFSFQDVTLIPVHTLWHVVNYTLSFWFAQRESGVQVAPYGQCNNLWPIDFVWERNRIEHVQHLRDKIKRVIYQTFILGPKSI